MMRSAIRRVRRGYGAQHDPEYRALQNALVQQRSLFMLGYVGIAYPAFYALDLVVYPEYWREFGAIRAAHAVLGIAVLAARKRILNAEQVVGLARTSAITATAAVALMCARTEGFNSLYVVGLILCYLAISTIEIFRPPQLVAVLSTLSAVYVAANGWLWGFPFRAGTGAVAFVGFAVVFCAISASLTENSRRTLFEAKEELRAKNDELAAARRQQEQFLSTVSHELRSPVNSILGFVELVEGREEEHLQPKSLANLSRVKESGRRLLAMINDLLDLSKAQAGQMELRRERFDVMAVVNEVAEATRALVLHRLVEVVVVGPSECPVYSDEQRFRQIATNLASNAARFTEEGRIELSVSADDAVVLQVRDTGPGIPEDARETIFEAFRQLGVSAGGTGLGLSIVRHLVQLLEGSIEVESTVGSGSTFRVRLPLQKAMVAA